MPEFLLEFLLEFLSRICPTRISRKFLTTTEKFENVAFLRSYGQSYGHLDNLMVAWLNSELAFSGSIHSNAGVEIAHNLFLVLSSYLSLAPSS